MYFYLVYMFIPKFSVVLRINIYVFVTARDNSGKRTGENKRLIFLQKKLVFLTCDKEYLMALIYRVKISIKKIRCF